MSSRVIHTTPRTMPPGPFAQAVLCGDTLYIAGQIGFDPVEQSMPQGDVAIQTTQALRNIRAILDGAEASFEDIVKMNCILPHLVRDYEAFNAAFVAELAGHAPARTTVGAELLPGCLVEIEAVAVMNR